LINTPFGNLAHKCLPIYNTTFSIANQPILQKILFFFVRVFPAAARQKKIKSLTLASEAQTNDYASKKIGEKPTELAVGV